MTKKIWIGAAAVAAAAVSAVALIASAQSTAGAKITPAPPQMLRVGQEGRVTMRGTVASVATGSLTVDSWGGPWTINVGADAKVLPSLNGLKAGDFVGILGTVSTSSNFTINATLVRDWTSQRAMREAKHREKNRERPRDYRGTASNLSGSSFTLTTAKGTVYTVEVASDAKILNRTRGALPFADIGDGNTVLVRGSDASGTITAHLVRDISLPAISQQAGH